MHLCPDLLEIPPFFSVVIIRTPVQLLQQQRLRLPLFVSSLLRRMSLQQTHYIYCHSGLNTMR